MVLLGIQLLKKALQSTVSGIQSLGEHWDFRPASPEHQNKSVRSGRGCSKPLMRSLGSWDSVEELGAIEVSGPPIVTSFSSCRKCRRISCDREKLLPSAGSGTRMGKVGEECGEDLSCSHLNMP